MGMSRGACDNMGKEGMMSNVERLAYTKVEVARMLGISVQTVNRMIARGEIPVIRAGKRILIPRDFVENFVNKWREGRR
ncbi:MAG: DNA-binding protein [Nitrososphaera sp.]